MECKFQVGDAVLCVEELNIFEALFYDCRGPTIDGIYHIRSIRMCSCPMRHIFVCLAELPSGSGPLGEERGFLHTMFRKLLTIDDFKSVETGAPVDSKDKVPEHV